MPEWILCFNDKMVIRLLEHKKSAVDLTREEYKRLGKLRKVYKEISKVDMHNIEIEAVRRGYLVLISKEEVASKFQELEILSPRYGRHITITRAGIAALTSGELVSEVKKRNSGAWVSRRSWIAIGISVAALVVSILLLIYRKQ